MATPLNGIPGLSVPENGQSFPGAPASGTSIRTVPVDEDEGPGQRMQFLEAAKCGDEDVVKELLKKRGKNNISIRAQDITKAILVASGNGHEKVIRELFGVSGYNYIDGDINADGRTALQAAAEGGYVEIVSILLRAGAIVNAAPSNYRGRTALQAAAGGGHQGILLMLLEVGADVNAPPSNDDGRTALQAAAGGGHSQIVSTLLSAHAQINAAPSEYHGRTALQAAAEGGHSHVVKYLRDAGAEVNASPGKFFGRTALQAAAEGGHANVLSFLLNFDADINALPSEHCGRTALQAAAGSGNLEIVLKLLEARADPNALPSKDHGRTALQAAAEGGHADILTTLLKIANINAEPSIGFGRTALQAAASGGHVTIVSTLLEAKATIDEPPSRYSGRTALQAAAENGHAEIVLKLLDAGADVNTDPSQSYGKTALQAAAGDGNVGIVKMLIKEGAEINARPSYYSGMTALQAAAEGGHSEVVSVLLAAGANVNADPSPGSGKTAIQAAAEGGHTEIVSILLEAGVEIATHSPNFYVRNALDLAVQGGHAEIVDRLIAVGVIIGKEAIWQISGRTWNSGHERVVHSLVKAGADINAPAFGKSGHELLLGLGAGRADVLKVLIEAGADFHTDPRFPEYSPLLLSAGAGHGDAVQLLLDIDAYSSSAIWAAAAAGHEDVVQLLIRSGVDVNARNQYGSTCLGYAIHHPNVVKILLENGANTSIQDSNGATPLHHAVLHWSRASIVLLLEAGANTESEDYENRRPLDILLHSSDLCAIPLIKLLLENGCGIRQCGINSWRKLLNPNTSDYMIIITETLASRPMQNSSRRPTLVAPTEYIDEDHLIGAKFSRKPIITIDSTMWLSELDVFKPPNSPAVRRLYAAESFLPGSRLPYFGTWFDYSKAPPHPSGSSTIIEWSWFLVHDRFFNDQQSGSDLPKIGKLTSTDKRALLNCYVRFELLVHDPNCEDESDDENDWDRRKPRPGKPFKTKHQKSEIAWTMRKRHTDAHSHPNIEGPAVIDADLNPIFRSEDFRSTLDIGWIPDHGIDFFTLFILDLHVKWRTLIEEADSHLLASSKVLLQNKGKAPRFIDNLLRDAQTWSDLRHLLQIHLRSASNLRREFEEKVFLREEVRIEPDQKRDGKSTGQIVTEKLQNTIKDMEVEIEEEIGKLDKKTKEMIQLEFSLVSIYEARTSKVTGISMKRLSWITFIFLPLMFVASLFGMNVDIVNNSPAHWWWVIVLSAGLFFLVISGWAFLKRFQIEELCASYKGATISEISKELFLGFLQIWTIRGSGKPKKSYDTRLRSEGTWTATSFKPPPRRWTKLKYS